MSELQPYQSLPPAQPYAGPAPAPVPQWSDGPAHRMTDQRPVSGAVVAIAWVTAVLTLGYMLPWAVAATRGRPNHGAIALVDLLLGWSLIGWVAALVMACQSHQVVGPASVNVVVAQQFAPGTTAPPQTHVGIAAGWYPAPDGPGRRYWDGTAWTQHRAH